MRRQGIKNIIIGILIIVIGITLVLSSNRDYLRYVTAKDHYKVTAELISSDEVEYYEQGSGSSQTKKSYYRARWRFTAGSDVGIITTQEETNPPSSKTLYVYRGKDGEFVVAVMGSMWSVALWLLIGGLIVAGGVIIVVRSVRKIRSQPRKQSH